MKSRSQLTRALAVLICAVAAQPITAHEFWIDAEPDGEGQVSANLRVGQDLSGSALPYLDTTIKVMTHVSPSLPRPINARLGDRPAISGLKMKERGLHILTVETNPSYIVFKDTLEFEDYLTYEGLTDIAALHRGRGLPETEIAEEYIRNARALVQVGPVGQTDTDRPTGLPFEIVIDGSPFVESQDTFAVRLTWRGTAAADIQIAMFHVPDAGSSPNATVRTLARTDDDGYAQFKKAGAGEYLLNAVRIAAVEGPGSVVWQSHWASLTFDIADPE